LKILIIGGYGYLGGRIAAHFKKNGHSVYLLSRDSSKHKKNLDNRQYKSIDFSWNSDRYSDLFKHYDCIIHSAGMNASQSQENPKKALNFKVRSNMVILDAIKHHSNIKYFYISSAHVYSRKCSGLFHEDSPLKNNHPYAKAILAGENIIQSSFLSNLNKSYILRCSNGYGAPTFDQKDCWELFVNNICKQAFFKKKILISHPSEFRNFVPITRICKIIEFILKKEPNSQILNAGSNKSMQLHEMGSLVKEACIRILGFTPELEFSNQLKFKDGYKYNISKINNLGFADEDNLTDEIENIFRYLKTTKK
jgi:UDP-glucose 4-epimerase